MLMGLVGGCGMGSIARHIDRPQEGVRKGLQASGAQGAPDMRGGCTWQDLKPSAAVGERSTTANVEDSRPRVVNVHLLERWDRDFIRL